MVIWNVTWRFDDTERVLLNSLMKDKILKKFTKEEAIALLYINQSILSDNVSTAYSDLIDKIEALSDDDWDFVKLSYPLSVSVAKGTSEEARMADHVRSFGDILENEES